MAGTDATETFYGLHRADVLQRPRFAKLKIGLLEGGVHNSRHRHRRRRR